MVMRASTLILAWAVSGLAWAANKADSQVILHSGTDAALHIDHGKAATPVTVQPFSYVSYYIDLPSNIASMTVTTAGATGEADLLIRQGIPHTANNLQDLLAQSSHLANTAGGNESIAITRSSTRAITPGR